MVRYGLKAGKILGSFRGVKMNFKRVEKLFLKGKISRNAYFEAQKQAYKRLTINKRGTGFRTVKVVDHTSLRVSNPRICGTIN